jgi:ABC-type thiamine transport system ATPase subunit
MTMIDALRRKDDPHGELARTVFIRLGRDVVDLLVAEAVALRRHPNHRIRLLEVIEQIGQRLGPREYYRVASLQRYASRVRQKAAQVLATLNPHDPELYDERFAALDPAVMFARPELIRRRRSRRGRAKRNRVA